MRIALFTINSIANKYGKLIEPKLSYQSEFYLRLFFKAKNSRPSNFHLKTFAVEKNDKIKIAKMDLQSVLCNICSEKYSMGGPIWLDPLNDMKFVQKVSEFIDSPENQLNLASTKKIKGLLRGILNVFNHFFIFMERNMGFF